MDNFQWLSVKDIVSKYKKFNVPSLQRTYRWGEKEITLLLNDLYEFYNTNEDSTNDFYPLQPLILKKNKNYDCYDILDGQQRLTTIKLIGAYLKSKDHNLNACNIDISYESRSNVEEIFLEIDKNSDDNLSDKYKDKMELYYISKAFACIENWFEPFKKNGKKKSNNEEAKRRREDSIYKVLFDDGSKSRFYVYELEDDADEKKIFQNINQGRISLSSSELIKPLFLGSVFETDDNVDKYSFVNTRDGYGIFIPIVKTKEKQALINLQKTIAQEWNDIETCFLHNEFYYFICPQKARSANRMDFLFEIAKNRYNECNRTTFDIFYDELKTNEGEKLIDSILSVWNDIVKCFNRLQKAYYDYDAYHLIGYCNTQKKIDISNILSNYCLEKINIQQLKDEVKRKIKSDIKYDDLYKEDGNIGDEKNGNKAYDNPTIDSLDYNQNKDKIKRILLLHNLQAYSSSHIRFPFDKYDDGREYDIEHIHAKADDKADKKSRIEWLKTNFLDLKEYESFFEKKDIKGDKKEIVEKFKDFLNEVNKEQDEKKRAELFEKLLKCDCDKEYCRLVDNDDTFKELVNIFYSYKEGDKDEVDNSLGNLCLLDRTTNRSYGNSLFITKRKIILNKCKNKDFNQLPLFLCTERIFLKYYSDLDKDDNLNFWSEDNRQDYFNDIKDSIKRFLEQKENDNE